MAKKETIKERGNTWTGYFQRIVEDDHKAKKSKEEVASHLESLQEQILNSEENPCNVNDKENPRDIESAANMKEICKKYGIGYEER